MCRRSRDNVFSDSYKHIHHKKHVERRCRLRKYQTIVSGASFLGLAFASCDPDNTLIIERGNILGCDMISSLRFDHLNGFKIKEDLTKELYSKIIMNNHMMFHDLILPNEIMPVLGRFVEDKKLNILFDCIILNQVETENGFIVEAICRDQILEFKSEYFIETIKPLKTENLSLNLIIQKRGDSRIIVEQDKVYELNNNLYVIEMPINSKSMSVVREKCLASFEKTNISQDCLIWMAEEVCIRGEFSIERKNKYINACSSYSNNLLDAMDKGVDVWRNL